MKITDIRLRLGRGSEEGGKLKAYVDITFDESFVVHGLKIIEGQNGLFVAMPSRRMPNGEFKDIAHPITPELRSELTRVILESYEKEGSRYNYCEFFLSSLIFCYHYGICNSCTWRARDAVIFFCYNNRCNRSCHRTGIAK